MPARCRLGSFLRIHGQPTAAYTRSALIRLFRGCRIPFWGYHDTRPRDTTGTHQASKMAVFLWSQSGGESPSLSPRKGGEGLSSSLSTRANPLTENIPVERDDSFATAFGSPDSPARTGCPAAASRIRSGRTRRRRARGYCRHARAWRARRAKRAGSGCRERCRGRRSPRRAGPRP